MSLKNYIEFKGTKDGLVIRLNEGSDFDNIKLQLIEKLDKAKSFFIGAKVAAIEGRKLTKDEESEILNIINNRFGMIMAEKPPSVSVNESVFEDLEVGITKFIKSTLRSGENVEFNGNIVVLGDVNPGAIIKAYGNIIIMGSLRGIAHAGSNGNEKAYVAALKLEPIQLRIGKYIARAPDEKKFKPKFPEIAFIKNEMIVIEPFLLKQR